MCKPSLNVVSNVCNRLRSSFLSLTWPWSGRSPPKGNQWECWDPGLAPNVVGLQVHMPPQSPLTSCSPWCPLMPPTPLLASNAFETPTPPASPNPPSDPLMPLTSLHYLLVPDAPWAPHPCWPQMLHTALTLPANPLMPPDAPTPLPAPTLPAGPSCPWAPLHPCQPPTPHTPRTGI